MILIILIYVITVALIFHLISKELKNTPKQKKAFTFLLLTISLGLFLVTAPPFILGNPEFSQNTIAITIMTLGAIIVFPISPIAFFLGKNLGKNTKH